MNNIPEKLKTVMLKLKILIDALYFQFLVSTFQLVRNVVFQKTRSTDVQSQTDFMRTPGLDQMRIMIQRRMTKSLRDANVRTGSDSDWVLHRSSSGTRTWEHRLVLFFFVSYVPFVAKNPGTHIWTSTGFILLCSLCLCGEKKLWDAIGSNNVN